MLAGFSRLLGTRDISDGCTHSTAGDYDSTDWSYFGYPLCLDIPASVRDDHILDRLEGLSHDMLPVWSEERERERNR